MRRFTPQKEPTRLTQEQRDSIDAAVMFVLSSSPEPLMRKHIASNRHIWETLSVLPLCRDDRNWSDDRHLDASLQRLHKAGKILFYRKTWKVAT